MPGEKQSGFMRAVHTDVAMPARNLAPGNVALVLSPPRTRSLPGAFFMNFGKNRQKLRSRSAVPKSMPLRTDAKNDSG